MMTSYQFFSITLPCLHTDQVSTQSDLQLLKYRHSNIATFRAYQNLWTKIATLISCHVTSVLSIDDVMMTSYQFFSKTLPCLHTDQVSTQSDLQLLKYRHSNIATFRAYQNPLDKDCNFNLLSRDP